jgi:hypothetical protein
MRYQPAALLLLAALHGAGAQSTAPTPKAIVARALAFMGGAEAVRSVKARKTTANDILFSVGQEEWHGADPPANAYLWTETFDYVSGILTDQPSPLGVPTRGITPVRVVDGDKVAALIRDTIRVRFGGPAARGFSRILRTDARRTPEALLLSALDAPDESLRPLPARARGGARESGVRATLPRDTLDLWFDAVDGRLVTIEALRPDPVLGERRDVIALSGWKPFGVVRLPTSIVQSANGVVSKRRVITSIETNPPAPSFPLALPDSFRLPTLTEALSVAELAPGIYRLEKGNGIEGYGGGVPYYSVAVRQGDSLVLIEAPGGPERSRMILDTLRNRFPSTAVKAVVVTHAHYDHLGGVAEFLDRGVRAIASRHIADFLRTVGISPSQKLRRGDAVTMVADTMPVGTGDTRFTLHTVPTLHARGMLVAYFPAHRLLVESDLQGLASPAEHRELLDFVKQRGLVVDRIAGLHGPVIDWQKFADSVK